MKKHLKNNSFYLLISLVLTLLVIAILILSFNLVEEEIQNTTLSNEILEDDIKEPTLEFDDDNRNSYDIYDEYPLNDKFASLEPIEIEDEPLDDIKSILDENIDAMDTNKSLDINNSLNQIEKSEKVEKTKEKIVKKEKPKINKNSPKLVIIVDDVSFAHQVKSIEKLNLNLTISFLPPNRVHPSTGKLAKKLDKYMIHLPLEAVSYPNEEENTLKVKASYESIDKRISYLRETFPKAKYINNHTGSKFTANTEAMQKLIEALAKYQFNFVDSRTTKDSVGKKVVKSFNMPYIGRNIFLDNRNDVKYIQNQIKKSVKIAKRQGFAIAICHPKKATFKALGLSKNILSEVNLINIYDVEF